MSEQHAAGLEIDHTDAGELSDAARTGKASDMFWVWGGVNVAVTNLAVGGLGIVVGLSLLDVLVVYLIGGVIGAALMGLSVVKGKLTGAAVMVNARPSFGSSGAALIAVILFFMSAGWFGINSYFGMTAARSIIGQIGLPETDATELVVLIVIVAAQIAITLFGFKLIRSYERLAVRVLLVALVILAALAIPDFKWHADKPLQGADHVGMMIFLFTALGAGWAISWTPWAHDFGRFVARTESDRKTFWSTFAGMYVVNLCVMMLGAGVASYGASALDVGAMVTQVTGDGWSIPFLLVLTLGLITANVVPLFSGGFALQSAGFKLPRVTGTVLTGIVGLPVPIIGIFDDNFANVFDQWMLALLVWIAPWLTITLIDFYVIAKRRYSRAQLYETWTTPSGKLFAPGLVAYAAGLLVSLPFINTQLWSNSFVSDTLHGADLSFWIGGLVAGTIYYPLAKARKSGAPVAEAAAGERQLA
ncbi:MAG TPA: cytosine permease [Solirubrobacter sp.]|nr:cytosine permease [Solirubrobacter sp.]